MLRASPNVWGVITAEQLRDARVRAGFTSQQALAEALGVSVRTVTSWEQEGAHVSTRAEARVRALLWPSPAPLAHYSDYELLSEIGRRLEAARRLETDDPDPASGTGFPNKPDRDRNAPAAAPPSGRRQDPAQGRAAASPTRRRNDARSDDLQL